MKISSSHCLKKLLRVLNLRKTSIIFTVSSLDETSDISKREQFHISDIYLDCKEKKQERFLKSREDRPEPFSLSQWKNSNQLYLTLGRRGSEGADGSQVVGRRNVYLQGDAVLHNAGQNRHKPQGSL
jgi:hypothetical protein